MKRLFHRVQFYTVGTRIVEEMHCTVYYLCWVTFPVKETMALAGKRASSKNRTTYYGKTWRHQYRRT